MRSFGSLGFGWARWNRNWIYENVGFYKDYKNQILPSFESVTSTIGPISFDKKLLGKPDEGKLHVRFEAAGDGNGAVKATAPFFDPTVVGFCRHSFFTFPFSLFPFSRVVGWVGINGSNRR